MVHKCSLVVVVHNKHYNYHKRTFKTNIFTILKFLFSELTILRPAGSDVTIVNVTKGKARSVKREKKESTRAKKARLTQTRQTILTEKDVSVSSCGSSSVSSQPVVEVSQGIEAVPDPISLPSTSGTQQPRQSVRTRRALKIAPILSDSDEDTNLQHQVFLPFTDTRVDLSSSTSEGDFRSSPSSYVPTPLKVKSKTQVFNSPEDEVRSIDMQVLKLNHRKNQLQEAMAIVSSSGTAQIIEPRSVAAQQFSNCLFVGETQKMASLMESVNEQRSCKTKYCRGILVPVKITTQGQGCSLVAEWACDGCQQAHVRFDSTLIESSKRTVVSLSTCVAFIISGCMFADYNKVMGLGLGMDCLSDKSFVRVLTILHPIVEGLLKEQCDANKLQMQSMDPQTIGSWNRGVTSSDGVWLTRGFFSKNFSFTVWNYVNSGLLYFQHLCQKGTDNVIEEGLYGGTSKAAEGVASEKTFALAKSEGMKIEVNWQDADSSSGNGFKKAFPEKDGSKVMLCGGHVNRALTKSLTDKSKMKTLSQSFKSKHRNAYPAVDTVVCECAKGNHKKNCGCLKAPFIKQSRVNFFCALLDAGKSPERLKELLYELSEHHCMDEHKWESGQCSFHPLLMCSCGQCKDQDNLKCSRKPYTSKLKVTCPLHKLLYEIEIKERAKLAEYIIHPDMGKGHSNIPESAHNILIHFRSKNWNIHRLHYFVATNLGLLQANSVFCYNYYGEDYSWIGQLYERLGLPVFPNLMTEWCKQMKAKMKRREFTTSSSYRSSRTLQKKARVLEQQERKKWLTTKSMMHHDYGLQGDEDEDIEDDISVDSEKAETLSGNVSSNFSSDLIELTDDVAAIQTPSLDVTKPLVKCKCGSTSHKRTSHKSCPLRKK